MTSDNLHYSVRLGFIELETLLSPYRALRGCHCGRAIGGSSANSLLPS